MPPAGPIFRIAIASDHAGFPLKDLVAKRLRAAGHDVIDYGTDSESSVDFSDYVYPAARAVSERTADRAILIDGAGYPSGIVANMLPDVYAAVCNDPASARLSREHTDANVLCLGGKIVGELLAVQIVDVWLATAFLGGRYQGRVDKVKQLSAKHRQTTQEGAARKVITVQDVRDALRTKRSLILSDETIITPSAADL